MTKEQQRVIDGFHERAISLIMKRNKAQRYNNWPEEQALDKQIEAIDDERRAYERDIKSRREKEPEIKGELPVETAGIESSAAETGL